MSQASVLTVPADRDTRSTILATGRRVMGAKGFSAVGLSEILGEAGVPKGSFYHYFGSKDAFGEAMLDAYFEDYLREMDLVVTKPGLTGAERLMLYFANWRETQGAMDCQGRCLTVKLAAEVSDLSETMRRALKAGTDGVIARLAAMIGAGVDDGSIRIAGTARDVATSLYHQWLGASVMVKILRVEDPFDCAARTTRQMIGQIAA
ncbi:MAG: TetR/AcrR family transcriptional regulator [Novosphingobium aromaticivorans]|jgi:TetR/AcrR family transcriptional repressor of nem operon|nr:TetR/AcrR family transcriptional regulator [Novosphingobium aromaticivorans]